MPLLLLYPFPSVYWAIPAKYFVRFPRNEISKECVICVPEASISRSTLSEGSGRTAYNGGGGALSSRGRDRVPQGREEHICSGLPRSNSWYLDTSSRNRRWRRAPG